VPTAGVRNQLSRLRMANEIQYIIRYVRDNNVCSEKLDVAIKLLQAKQTALLTNLCEQEAQLSQWDALTGGCCVFARKIQIEKAIRKTFILPTLKRSNSLKNCTSMDWCTILNGQSSLFGNLTYVLTFLAKTFSPDFEHRVIPFLSPKYSQMWPQSRDHREAH